MCIYTCGSLPVPYTQPNYPVMATMTTNFRLSSLSVVMVSVILAPFLLRPTVDMIDIPPGGEILRFSDARGPESVAFDSHGRGPYVSVEDGRIMRWNGGGEGWSDFATTRPRR